MVNNSLKVGTVLLWAEKSPQRRQATVFEAVEKFEGFAMNTQHRIRAVIWDLDGVILRDEIGAHQPVQPVQAARIGGLQHPSLGSRQIDHTLLGFIAAMRRSVHTALLVNSWADIWEIVNLQDALAPAFDRVIQAVDTGLHRPDPRIFTLAVIRLGIAPGEAVLVDDNRTNVAAARQAGLHAYEFENPAQIGSQLMDLLMEPVN